MERGEVSLSGYYKRQYGWRDWPTVFRALPPLQGKTVLDLGCGVGDQAAELTARGARVIGVDINEELLGEARSRRLPNAEFRLADLRSLGEPAASADGLWCSFAAAYFPAFSTTLTSWALSLRPGGWVAITEIDDMFGHEPLGARTKSLFDGYTAEALAAERYDFHMGRKLPDHLERAGFTTSKRLTLEDQELAFHGPARPEVIEAWTTRLEGMGLLRDFCGPEFAMLRDDFLGCLSHPHHRTLARVYCCIATKPGRGTGASEVDAERPG